jgi:hypothetical protein
MVYMKAPTLWESEARMAVHAVMKQFAVPFPVYSLRPLPLHTDFLPLAWKTTRQVSLPGRAIAGIVYGEVGKRTAL